MILCRVGSSARSSAIYIILEGILSYMYVQSRRLRPIKPGANLLTKTPCKISDNGWAFTRPDPYMTRIPGCANTAYRDVCGVLVVRWSSKKCGISSISRNLLSFKHRV